MCFSPGTQKTNELANTVNGASKQQIIEINTAIAEARKYHFLNFSLK